MKFIPVAVTRFAAKTAFKAQQNSPELLFGAGVVGFVATAVLTGRATLRLEEKLIEHEKTMTGVEMLDQSQEDTTKDKALVYTNTTIEIVKLYAPAVLVGTASIAAFGFSHRILTKRNAALMTTVAMLDRGWREYRARVIKDVGPEKDRDYMAGTQEVMEKVVDKKGKLKESKKTVRGNQPAGIYSFIFDENCKGWSDGPGYNQTWLASQETHANARLRANGFLFLNDVLEQIGLPRTPAGQIVGWIKDSEEGDGYVDFGIFEGNSYEGARFASGAEDAVWLEFNCDGPIVDKI